MSLQVIQSGGTASNLFLKERNNYWSLSFPAELYELVILSTSACFNILKYFKSCDHRALCVPFCTPWALVLRESQSRTSFILWICPVFGECFQLGAFHSQPVPVSPQPLAGAAEENHRARGEQLRPHHRAQGIREIRGRSSSGGSSRASLRPGSSADTATALPAFTDRIPNALHGNSKHSRALCGFILLETAGRNLCLTLVFATFWLLFN